jgi:hypothetical protein
MNHIDAPAETAQQAVTPPVTDTRLHGRWLLLARFAWAALVGFGLVFFLVSLPLYFAHYQTICTATACASGQLTPASAKTLQGLGFSATGYATLILLLTVVTALVSVVVALVIILRQSDNWMGLLVAFMLVMESVGPTTDASVLTAAFGPVLAEALNRFFNFLSSVSLVLVFYLFPNGRFVPRWTRWLMVAFLVIGVLILFLPSTPPVGPLYVLGSALWLSFLISLGVAQVYRYRRVSTPVERQQTKWVVYSLAWGLMIGLGLILPTFIFPSLMQSDSLYNLVSNFLLSWGFSLLLVLSFGIAILRYRLWDIDILINRTLVYGTLTVILTAVYVGLVIGLQALLRGIINQGSGVAIVLSTLAIAALFQSLRRRIQRIIDRRFYRSKYDAAKTVAAFSATLRNEVDLDQLREHLLDVVQETMQPAHVSLWLRPPQRYTEERHRLKRPHTNEEGY